MTSTHPTLTDGTVILRRPVMADVAARVAAGNDREIQRMYGVQSDAVSDITQEQAAAWVAHHMKQDHSWFIDVKGALSGQIFLHTFNQEDQRASLAMGLLRKSDLGKGYGSRALRLLLGHAFSTLGLHRISLRVLAYNARAIGMYKRVGFVFEGRERQSARVGTSWHDDVMMGILAPDWRAQL